jgi:indolepyruvate ferredoxin oxidoreductase beta subunit
MRLARRRGWLDRAYLGMKINASSVFGYLRLRFLASLRRFRRGTWRSSVEQNVIEAWLDDIARAAAFSLPFAMEVAATAGLVKGYGDTFRRGMDNFNRIRDRVIGPALAAELPMTLAVDALSNARAAALADPEGTRLETVLAGIGAGTAAKIADAAE